MSDVSLQATKAEKKLIKDLVDRQFDLYLPHFLNVRRTSSRICFGVEHGDYNGTNLAGAAIGVDPKDESEADGFIWFAYRPNETRLVRIKSLNFPDAVADFNLGEVNGPEYVKSTKDFPWTKFPMAADYVLRKNGYHIEKGISGLLVGKIPEGGLSRSASLSLNLLHTFLDVNGIHDVDSHEIVSMAKQMENEYIGSPCGDLDQYMIEFGKLGKLTYCDKKNGTVRHFDLPEGADPAKIVILDTGTKRHGLQSTDYVLRQKECFSIVSDYGAKYGFKSLAEVTPEMYNELMKEIPEQQQLIKNRLQYVFEANQRFENEMLACWEKGDWKGLGKIINEDGIGLNELYDISGPHLEKMVQIARKDSDVYGARMSGGGRFGASYALRNDTDIAPLVSAVNSDYRAAFPEFEPAVHVCSFVDGVAKLKL